MTKENMSKCISLIGPSCVGKSLLAEELGKKYNLPVINFDDFIALIQHEMHGFISPDKEHQKQFVELCIETMLNDPKTSNNIVNKEYYKKTQTLICEFLHMYDNYRYLIGDFKPLYKLVEWQEYLLNKSETAEEGIFLLTNATHLLLGHILEKINTPVIFDFPAPYGWHQKSKNVDKYTKSRLKDTPFKIKLGNLEKEISKILSYTHSILLTPGLDYERRNAVKDQDGNNILLKNLENYYTNADLVVTTNGLFNTPEHNVFQRRNYFDGEEMVKKEKLRNNAEIKNLCDEISTRIDELTMGGM